MGQASNRKKASVSSAIDFYNQYGDALELQVSKSYKLDEPAAILLMEDTGVPRKEPLQEIIAGLFFWRDLVEMTSMVQMSNKIDKIEEEITPKSVIDWDYNFTKQMVDDGTYTNWNAAIKEKVKMAMTYRCYEPWDDICGNYIAQSDFPESQLHQEAVGKVVSYLYDAYTTEEYAD